MRWIRNFSVAVFLLAVVVFGGYKLYRKMTVDPTGPQIAMEEDTFYISARAEEADLLEGIRAEDKKDGDLTGQIILEKLSNFIEPGVRTMQVAVVDSDGHVAKATREIHYTDYEPPKFELTGPLRVPSGSDSFLTNVKAVDMLDGDLSEYIKVASEEGIYLSYADEYQVELSVTNSAGDTTTLQATLTVYSERTQPGSIELSEYLVYTTARHKLDPWDYVQTIVTSSAEYTRNSNGELRWRDPDTGAIYTIAEEQVEITNEVNYNQPGSYEITYRYTDEEEYESEVRLIVVVQD